MTEGDPIKTLNLTVQLQALAEVSQYLHQVVLLQSEMLRELTRADSGTLSAESKLVKQLTEHMDAAIKRLRRLGLTRELPMEQFVSSAPVLATERF